MFFAIVVVKLEWLGEGLIARLVAARVENFGCMIILMLNQFPTIAESLVTTFVSASKRSFSGVHVHMVIQSLPSSECPTARITFAHQGALLMCAVMLSQFSAIRESLAARVVLANEKTRVCMCVVVVIQCLTVVKILTARLVVASIQGLNCMPAVVGLEG